MDMSCAVCLLSQWFQGYRNQELEGRLSGQLAQAEDWAPGQEAFQGDRTFPRTLDLFWTPYSLYLC